jgi:hypothetical protein
VSHPAKSMLSIHNNGPRGTAGLPEVLAGFSRRRPALKGKRGPTGQHVETDTVRMVDLETLSGSCELPSNRSRQPRPRPTPKGKPVGLAAADKSCSPGPWKQTRLPGESYIPPETTNEVTVSEGRFRFVPALCTYLSHVHGKPAPQISTVAKAK